jgi:formylglycine-generating enzyme required for sulfatase activity
MVRRIRRIFVSYSRRNEAWVYNFHGELRRSYDAWIDDHILGASNWWASILEEIEECDVFIAIMSNPYMESPYCIAELEYAEALNKPIVPLMIEDCDYPSSLDARNIQFTKMSMRQDIRDTMNQVLNIFVGLQPEIHSGRFDPPQTKMPRPSRPVATRPSQAQATFELAQKAEQEGACVLAEELYTEVIKADPQGLGMQALESIKRITVLTQKNIPTPPVRAQHDAANASNLRPAALQRARARAANASNPIQAALQRARSFNGTRNDGWQSFMTYFPDLKIKDMPFCLVPPGDFQMGSNDGHYNDEKPVHTQTIAEPYWIAQYPVTNAQWKLGVDAGAVKQPPNVGNSLKWYNDPVMNAAPVVGVDWFMARDFAVWLDCRLLTELEWEYAARGVQSWRYPWGDDWNPAIPVWSKNSGMQPAVVTSKHEGNSWSDAGHMIGNVWEWTNSLHEQYPYQAEDGRELDAGDGTDVPRVLRGGSWAGNNVVDFLSAACRIDRRPNVRFDDMGFRVARSLAHFILYS